MSYNQRKLNSMVRQTLCVCVHACARMHGYSVVSDSLRPHGPYVARQAPKSIDFPGKDPGVGCYFFLQGIFWTHG